MDSTLSSSSTKRQSYYISFSPSSLSLINQTLFSSSIKFLIYKGTKKWKDTSEWVQLDFTSDDKIPLNNCDLNLYIADISKDGKKDFVVKCSLKGKNGQEEMGEFRIEVSEMVLGLKEENKKCWQKIQKFGNFVIEFQIFIQRTRAKLEKLVKETKLKLPQSFLQSSSQITEFQFQSQRSQISRTKQLLTLQSSHISDSSMTKRTQPNKPFQKHHQVEKKLKSEPSSTVRESKDKRVMRPVIVTKLNKFEEKLEVKKEGNIMMRNIIWLVVSLLLIYWVMIPSRKVSYKKAKGRFM